MAVAWAPDGRMFIAEKDGVLKVRSGATTSTVLDLRDRVNDFHDRGLMGLAVDSSFSSNGYLYLLYTRQVPMLTQDSDDPMVSQLLRVTVNASSVVTGQQVVLGSHDTGPCPAPSNTVDCIPSEGTSHSIGSVHSAPDGTLFLGSGDAAGFGGVDNAAFRSYDERSMAGKIMRVDRDGRGVAGHAFCPLDADTTHVCTKLWAKGFRNPFRFKLRPGGGLAVADVGWANREEIDLISSPGGSYGWPCYEGTIRTPGYRDHPSCPAEYAREGTPQAHRPPNYDYGHDVGATTLAGPTYSGDQYPEGYRGSLFFADYIAGFVKRLVPAGSGQAVAPFASGWSGVDVAASPAGNLVYVSPGDFSDGTGAVREVVYSPGNARPTAVAEADRNAGSVPLEVRFDGRRSSDPDRDSLSYDWDFGDGSPHSSRPDPTHTFTAPGNHSVTLTVSDGRGKSDLDTLSVSADNTAPEPVLSVPGSFRGGSPLTVTASASDAEDGELPPSAFSWNVRLQHGELHSHPIVQQNGVREVSFQTSVDHDADSYYVARVSVTDSGGGTASASAEIRPETAPVTILSDPPGAPLSYAGRDVAAPFSASSTVGLHTTASAGEAFGLGESSFAFEGWEDGGERLRELVVPPGGTTLKARYRDVTPRTLGATPVLPARDARGPQLTFSARTGFDPRRGVVAGGAQDPSGVKRVDVAVARALRGGGCRWWLPSKGRLSRDQRSCRRPEWIPAKLSGGAGAPRWKASLRRRGVPAGGYRLLFRAIDLQGNETRLLGDGARVAKVRVRPCGARAASCR